MSGHAALRRALADGISVDMELLLALAEQTALLGRRVEPAERVIARRLVRERGIGYAEARFEVRRVRIELERLWILMDTDGGFDPVA